MGGVDKGLVHLNGKPMVQHVLDRLAPQLDAGAVAINANRSHETYAALGIPVFADALTGFEGPLAGVIAGMDFWSNAPKSTFGADFTHVLTVPCDSPFFPVDLVAKLAQAMTENNVEIAVVRTASGAQPVFALYAIHLRDSLATFLKSGKRKIDVWTAQHSVAHVYFDNEKAFTNINTEKDLVAAGAR